MNNPGVIEGACATVPYDPLKTWVNAAARSRYRHLPGGPLVPIMPRRLAPKLRREP